MKTILVPTDFSKNSEQALDFSILVAKQINAKLVLLNTFQLPIAVAEIPYEVLNEERNEQKKESESKLLSECEKIKGAGIDYEYHAVEGQAIDAVLDFSGSMHFDYIIMGTKGAGKSAGIFGSTTTRLMSKTDIPLIAIPENVHFSNKIKKITFATDYNLTDVDAIIRLSEFASAFNAQINVLHISKLETPVDEQKRRMKNFMKIVNSESNYNNISFQLMAGENIEEVIEHYIEKGHDADIIVMSTHMRNALERLFGKKSLTKEIALKTEIPLIVFHYHKEASLNLNL